MADYDRYLRKVEYTSDDLPAFTTADQQWIEQNIGELHGWTYAEDGKMVAKIVKQGYDATLDDFTGSVVKEVKEMLEREGGMENVRIVPVKGRRLEVYEDNVLKGKVRVGMGSHPDDYGHYLPNGDTVWQMQKYDWEDFDQLARSMGKDVPGRSFKDPDDMGMDFSDAVERMGDYSKTHPKDPLDGLSENGRRRLEMLEKHPDVIKTRMQDETVLKELGEKGLADDKTVREIRDWMKVNPDLGRPAKPPAGHAAIYHYKQPVLLNGAPSGSFMANECNYGDRKIDGLFTDFEFYGKWGVVSYDTDHPFVDKKSFAHKNVLLDRIDSYGMVRVGSFRLTSQELALRLERDDPDRDRKDPPDDDDKAVVGLPDPYDEPKLVQCIPELILTDDDLPKQDTDDIGLQI